RNARTIVGNPNRYRLRVQYRVDPHPRFLRGMPQGVVEDIAQRLFDQGWVGTNHRQTGGKGHFYLLRGAASARSSDDPLDHLAEIHPVAAQFEAPRIDPGNRKQIADHLIETFGLMLDLIEKISLNRWIKLVAVVEKTRRRA